jgi:hypothetical protein
MGASLGRHSPAMHGVLSDNQQRRLAKQAATARAAACAAGRHPAGQQRLATPAAGVAWTPPRAHNDGEMPVPVVDTDTCAHTDSDGGYDGDGGQWSTRRQRQR